MKVLPFKIPKPTGESLVYQEDDEITFYNQLHQHDEIQISYIVEGSGSLIVGDKINRYKQNDILVIGQNIPHVFRSDVVPSSRSIMYTLFFTKTSFGKDFFEIRDLSDLDSFFMKVVLGMKITSRRELIIQEFKGLKHLNRIELLASLLKILSLIIQSDAEHLASFISEKKYSDSEGKRMNVVLQYTLDNFQEPLTLEEIAEKANMTKNAFCRYFKKRTNKTFFQFLIEIRIENACQLLYDVELSIAEISVVCGFRNIANFNRQFKELKGITPSQFRLQAMEKRKPFISNESPS